MGTMNPDFYDLFINQFNSMDYRSLGWKTKKDQEIRFEKIFEIGISPGDSVLDIGSGLSDFYFFLREKIGDFSYVGIEPKEQFYSVSKVRYSDYGNFKVLKKSISEPVEDFPSADWVVASGLFPFKQPKYYRNFAAKSLLHCAYF